MPQTKLHVFRDSSKRLPLAGAVPDAEIDFAIEAKKLVDQDLARFTAEWEL
ncbi:MAG: hypothetical protein HYX68_10140 [Planctomycetes bacterium]|jgi:hypothetical protein|nr:hypothetical protein [Planctomycetota bacterium]